ncbi:ketoacyl-ACP synthase III [Paenibacillus sp. L3-i20]|uniref:ketoacyl-ACP synthase III n=1 Tax=Paenibacillus sp. L3-i20 TaxID=2905833 RepID=UPI001EE11BC3|nr:ketoacyl-ACP synthase III [Paenibacillus sp. L3-i20]GKU80198.1 3-oxoacyl-[acyl-carrier-protein] synthase 3 protein 2 [Paenibacillus sp. L3-i20]
MTSHNKGELLRSNAKITAIGTYVPERKLTNEDLEKLVETSDEWIVQRTGIHERRIAAENEFTSDLIFSAITNMIDRYSVNIEDVDYIIVATSTPDTIFPSMAARVQERFGVTNCGTIDIQAACAGFTAGLQLGNGMLLTGMYRKILVVGADALSKITDYSDRTTCIIFGDGAGAVMMERTSQEQSSFIATYSDTDGSGGHNVYLNNLSASIGEHPIATNGKLVQNGREVYRWAISSVAEGVRKLIHLSGLTIEEIDWFVPHNANQRIIDALNERIGFKEDQSLSSIAHYGNTSAASIPLALDDAIKDGRVQNGHTLLLHGFGGGLTQAGVVLRWTL